MRHLLVSANLLVASALPSISEATPYWVVDNMSEDVFVVDVDSLTATKVGASGLSPSSLNFGGLGFSQDGTLYAMSSRSGGNDLYTVDQGNGAFTLVGSNTFTGMNTFDINPVTNEAIAWSQTQDQIHAVSLLDGSTSFLTNTTLPSSPNNSAFAPDGSFFTVDRDADQLYRIDIDTGAATLVGSLGIDVRGTNLGFNPSDGMLYMIEIQDPNYPLYQIDPTTGAGIVLGSVSGFPADPDQQITMGTFAPIPEPTTSAILALGLIGLAILRRRGSASSKLAFDELTDS